MPPLPQLGVWALAGLKLLEHRAYFCSMHTLAPHRCDLLRPLVRCAASLLYVLLGSSTHGQFYRKVEYFVDTGVNMRCFSPTSDGGLLLTGWGHTDGIGEWHAMKTDQSGDVEWTARYGPTSLYAHPVAMPLAGGGHLLVGKLFYSSAMWTSLIHIDDQGALVSQRALGRLGFSPLAFRPITLSNGDLLIADFAFQGFALTRLSSSGDVLWSNTRQMASTMAWVDILDPRADAYETPQGDIVACGAVMAHSATMDAFVIKVSGDGDLLWHRTFGAAGADGFRWVLPTSDGGVIAYGTLSALGQPQLLVVRLAADGAVLWQKTIGGAQMYHSAFLLALPNGNYLIGAKVGTSLALPTHPLILELSEAGALLWAEEYAVDDQLLDGRVTADGIDMLAIDMASGEPYDPILRKFSDLKEHCEAVLPHSLIVTDVLLQTTQPLIVGVGKTLSEPDLTQEALEVPFVELCFQSSVQEANGGHERSTVFPNPAMDHCALSGIEGKHVEQLLLYDAQGRFLADLTEQAHGRIDLRALTPGPYGFRIAFRSGERQVVRFVVGG